MRRASAPENLLQDTETEKEAKREGILYSILLFILSNLTSIPFTVPPAKSEPTTTLLVRNFVRPFTLKAVKEYLAEHGTVKAFWINDIKTHCYVTVSAFSNE